MELFDALSGLSTRWFGPEWGPPVWTLVKTTVLILCIVLPMFGLVAYLTLWERKLIGWMQIRIGPNRVGPIGLLQPIADAVKLMFKELIVPAGANKVLFIFAPMLTLMPALAAWAVIPFSPEVVLADINAGLLYVMAITSMGVYGVIIAGWASNSKYAFLGAMRSAAQIVAYEIAMGFALVCVLMVSQSLNLTDIVAGQNRGYFADKGLAVPLLELAAAPADVPRLLHRRDSGDEPRALRRRRRRVRDRRRIPRRVLRHDLRALFPRRVRQHDPRVRARHHHVPRRLGGTLGQRP